MRTTFLVLGWLFLLVGLFEIFDAILGQRPALMPLLCVIAGSLQLGFGALIGCLEDLRATAAPVERAPMPAPPLDWHAREEPRL